MRNLSIYSVSKLGTYPRRRMFRESILSPQVWRSVKDTQALIDEHINRIVRCS